MTTSRSRTPFALLTILAALAALAAAGCKKERLCPSDQALCGEACIAVTTDALNCGACGHACAAGETCSAGQCLCADGRADCDGACVDLASDPENCGACGATCVGELSCTTPAGSSAVCASGCAEADQTTCGRACVKLQSDRWNCGACGRSCGTGERCEAGSCAADLYLACYNSSEVREATRDLQPAGLPLAVAAGPVGLTWLDGALFAASAYYQGAETLTRIDRGPPQIRGVPLWTSEVTPDIQFLAARGGLLYLAHSSLGTLLVLSPEGDEVEEHAFVGTGEPNPNPLGVAFAGDDAYVALNARDEVAILDVSQAGTCATSGACIQERARVSVAGLASAGASAGPARIAVAGGRAYVTLWNLDPNWRAPEGSSGRLAVIDLATRALDASVSSGGVAGLVDLGTSCLNPADLALSGSTLYVTCGAFDYSGPDVAIRGGAVVPVDLSGGTPVAGAAFPAPEGAAPGDLAFCSGSGYVADRNSGRVFRLDPAAGAVGGVELCPEASGKAYVADIACGY